MRPRKIGRATFVAVERKGRDLWIGAYWSRTETMERFTLGHTRLDLWVCLVPCFPLHVIRYGR